MAFLSDYPSGAAVARLREEYPKGTRVRLVVMDDAFAPAPGTLGTVEMVDDVGQIHVAWENGSHLALIPGVDSFHKTNTQ